MTYDVLKNAAYSLVATAPSPATSGTTLVVTAGEGMRFPSGSFDLTIWPAGAQPRWAAGGATGGNFEICRATVSGDTLTLTRAQYGTTARTVIVGDQVAVNLTAAMLAQIEAATLDQIAALNATAADVSLNSHKLTNVTDPAAAQDAATKNYVDTAIAGLYWKQAVRLATQTALPANTYSNGASGVGATLTGVSFGALAIDGATVVVGDRVLVKNEVAGANNGIYVVTTVGAVATLYVLTRATDYNQTSEVQAGDAVYVTAGSANVDTSWVMTTTGTITIGTTSLTFTQFGGNLVTSVFGRTGAVVAATNDYSEAQLSFTDITTNNVGTSKHGFAPKSPNDATKYLDGTGAYSAPAGGQMVLIASQVLSGTQATFDTNTLLGGNIAATYNHLLVKLYGRGDVSAVAANVYMRFNNDSGSNYDWEYLYGSGTTPAALEGLAAAQMILSEIPGATATASVFSQATIEINNYAGTTGQKGATCTGASKRGTSTGLLLSIASAGFWRSTAAVNRIQILLSSGSFVSGSAVYFYGVT